MIVAPDAGLRQAVTFALEVEGYNVQAYETWADGIDHIRAHLWIIDDQIVWNFDGAMKHADDPARTTIILADGMTPPPEKTSALILTKPFDGSELLMLVKELALAA